MKTTKWLTLLLALCASLVIVPWMGSAARAEGEEMTWEDLQNALDASNGENPVVLQNNVVVPADKAVTINGNNTVTLDLAGHTLSRSLSEPTDEGFVVKVFFGSTLTLMDSSNNKTGTITGGWNSGEGGGVFVDSYAVFQMHGGTITGNIAANGGGVYVAENGVFNVSGSVVITGNTDGAESPKPNNVYLSNDTNIELDEKLATDSRIGITTETKPDDGEGNITPITVTNMWWYMFEDDEEGYRIIIHPAEYLFSDDPAYAIRLDINEAAVGPLMTWAEVASELRGGGTVTLINDVYRGKNDDVIFTSQFSDEIPTLNLNGFKLDAGENGCIRLEPNMRLKITDKPDGNGQIIGGGDNQTEDAVIWLQDGTLILDGGTITGKPNKIVVTLSLGSSQFIMNGGKINGKTNCGVCINENGAFIMSGGSIENNADGVLVNKGSFKMSGGSITGNTVYGVAVGNDGSISLSGSPVIFGNASGDIWNGNLHLSSGFLENGNTVKVTGALADSAKIGVTMETDTPGVFAVGDEYTLSDADEAYFVSDNSEYEVKLDGGQLKLAEKPKPTFSGRQLILSGQIGMHFYMSIPDQYLESGSMTFKVGDRTVTANGELQSDGRYKYTCFITSIEMAEPITAAYSYTDAGETKTVTHEISVEEYLKVLIENEDNKEDYTKATPLAKAIYNYGHYAMQAVPGGSKHPAMPDTYITEANLVTSLEGYAISATLDNTIIKAASYSLDLESETAINIYITTDTELTTENVDVTAPAGTTYDYTVEKVGTRYRVRITGIAAHELGSAFTVTIDNSTITASALTYVQQRLANPNADEKTKKAAAALYDYYLETIAYLS